VQIYFHSAVNQTISATSHSNLAHWNAGGFVEAEWSAPALSADPLITDVQGFFKNCDAFDERVLKALREAIAAKVLEVEGMEGKKVRQRYFKDEQYVTEVDKIALKQIDSIFETAYVQLLSSRPDKLLLRWPGVEELLVAYPQFGDQAPSELSQLLRFRNALKIALEVFPVKDAKEKAIVVDNGRNKGRIFAIAARIERGKTYSLGTGMCAAAKRRLEIYYKEGGVFPENRAPRDRTKKAQASASCGFEDFDSPLL
jgi:hypothetical protein